MAELVALLDIGSNACRFVLARISPGTGFRVLREERVQTRLGGGRPGALPRDAIDATLSSIHRFLGRFRTGRVPRILAVATSAVREAANRERLLDALRQREGIEVEVLSGSDEAHLGALAVLRSLPVRDALIADLGGGSLQLTRLRDARVAAVSSLRLGAVHLTSRFLRHDPPTVHEVRALRQETRDRLLETIPPAPSGDALVGLGGTVRALARIHLATGGTLATRGTRLPVRHGLPLHQSDVTAIRERLERLPIEGRRRLPGLKAERADIIVAGALVVEELMLFGGYFVLTVCAHRVRDGLLWREASVAEP